MLTLFHWESEGPLLHFDFATNSFEDDGLAHTVLEAPLALCYEETLLPLVREHGEKLTADEVTRALSDRVVDAGGCPMGIDWLGLALYAARRFREATAGLSGDHPEEYQKDCLHADILAKLLEAIYFQVASAVYAELPQLAPRWVREWQAQDGLEEQGPHYGPGLTCSPRDYW